MSACLRNEQPTLHQVLPDKSGVPNVGCRMNAAFLSQIERQIQPAVVCFGIGTPDLSGRNSTLIKPIARIVEKGLHPTERTAKMPFPAGEMAEWLKAHAWKACILQKGIEGSNPSLSASLIFLRLAWSGLRQTSGYFGDAPAMLRVSSMVSETLSSNWPGMILKSLRLMLKLARIISRSPFWFGTRSPSLSFM